MSKLGETKSLGNFNFKMKIPWKSYDVVHREMRLKMAAPQMTKKAHCPQELSHQIKLNETCSYSSDLEH